MATQFRTHGRAVSSNAPADTPLLWGHSRTTQAHRHEIRLRRGMMRASASGWGTWIRTKINGVRVRCSTVELSPKTVARSAS